MLIAVIDEAINQEYIPGLQLKKAYTVQDNEITEHFSTKKMDTHGTTCAAIINKYAPSAEIISIQVLEGKKGQVTSLVKALKWCLHNKIDIVHMSLGSIQFNDFLSIRKVVNELLDEDIVVVAAKHNKDIYTVPACLPGVFCVKSSDKCSEQDIIVENDNYTDISLLACGSHSLANCFGHKYVTSPSNSFAAPVVTAKISNILAEKPADCNTKNWKYCLREIYYRFHQNEISKAYLGTIDCFAKAKVYGVDLDENVLPFSISEEAKTLIYVPCDQEPNNRVDCYIKTRKIDNLIYAGKLEENMKRLLNSEMNGFVIDESLWEKHENSSFEPIKVLLIGIIGDAFAVKWVKQLHDVFLKHQYYSITCSSIKYGYLYDMHYIPFNIDCQLREHRLSELAEKYLCDLLIYHISEKDQIADKCDYIIHSDQLLKDTSALKIYEDIVRMFT